MELIPNVFKVQSWAILSLFILFYFIPFYLNNWQFTEFQYWKREEV